jgi:uncharacterized protein
MSAETGYQAVDAVVRSALHHTYQKIMLKYAGGEPTLQLPLLVALHRYAQGQAAAHGLELAAGVLSNGVLLTRTTAVALAELGVSLMVSLDLLMAGY